MVEPAARTPSGHADVADVFKFGPDETGLRGGEDVGLGDPFEHELAETPAAFRGRPGGLVAKRSSCMAAWNLGPGRWPSL
jgi:hypothetical protein